MARARARRPAEPRQASPPVVGIGASAGGVQALQTLFEALPVDLGLAYVVILHLAPDRESELGRILSLRTSMPVTAVDKLQPLEPNHVYVIPPDRSLAITHEQIAAERFTDPGARRAPIDFFFRSLAAQHGDGFAVILSGGGSDGALGVKAVKEAAGIVLVQDPTEAEHPSMPSAAIATGAVDIVLPLKDLAGRLAELATAKRSIADGELADGEEEYLRRILAQLRVRTGHDFTSYKRSTVLRRIQRRAQVTRKDRLFDYYAYLRDHADEAQALFADLLISVTSFFRDPHAYEALAAQVIPQLFEGREAADQVRVWASGCATGEEAYSIGMLLLEEAHKRDVRPEIQVFGSDLDSAALTVAREGRYPVAIEADVTPERLRRFFVREGDHYQVKRELRDVVLFANHSLLRDPPFSRIDLISCRNLLIYLERDLQQQVIATFHYALAPGGYLFLGSSETADHPGALFRTVDRESHLYQALAGRKDKLPSLPRLVGAPTIPGLAPPVRPPSEHSVSESTLHREGLEQASPPSILVDEAHHAVHLSEMAGRYLQPAGGRLTADLIELARPELRLELRAALHRAFERGEASLSMPILVKFNGDSHRVYLQVRPLLPLAERGARRAVVFFIEGEAVDDPIEADGGLADDRASGETVRQLAEELRLTQARLRAMREESEAANEELRAANEELQSINEEYRSTSEELETSKEELQSVNEELQTVNNELKHKLEGVSRANSDLQNLMAATDVATLFLDASLKIKRFTPRLTELFNVTANDEGRPITDFTHQLKYDALPQDALGVLRDLRSVEREVQSGADSWFLMRLRPYRTMDDRIDGVVVTFVDITERRQIEEALRQSEEQLRQETRLVELAHFPIFVWDLDGGIVQWNRGSEQLYGYTKEMALGRRKNALLQTEVAGSASFDAVAEALLATGNWSGELSQTTWDGRRVTVEAELELATIGGKRLVLESVRDITDRKTFERAQEMMLAELSHRVKNTLAVVQSIASQTLRTSDNAEQFSDRFEGRLQALSRSHRLLLDPWEGADIEAVAREQLEAHLASDSSRLSLTGAPLRLAPDVAVPLGLVLHELATNAAKYGAWSVPGGTVSLSWSDGVRRGKPVVTIIWREAGGPPVNAGRDGFGSRLIESAIPNARVRREFKTEGVEATIEAPAPEARDE